ncbi:DUF2501 domain-containing protein [Salinisphaera sp. Q1T1-3]|uniref:DUF2501 domain-containing protein n=1 Tax=Salinisphaera sp. Q1T1-3 TaxID=2321229 RepID=UPI000E717FAD|nr:DUF2501 domain-containing protein [Salinisphaera sp. Q1T1-3]RJS92392.1 DUF2501 domain-containing protein [Salinisphaera sp. Q1T1-3]
MNKYTQAAAILLAGALVSTTASAGALDNLKNSADNAVNGASNTHNAAGGSALLSQLTTGSLNLGNVNSVAGVLGYCQKQGFTEGPVDRVKSQLMGKLGGDQNAQNDADYQKGLSGVLNSKQGHGYSLTGMKAEVGKRACRLIANKAASSFLGG